ncbi:hypothetical protein C9374_009342 [Naegleria lovaniensis]|uniref:Uncharacterized protein n=1 Tax=Naegleria lovaniensis TaxID=51637 RepID=A0AA88GHT5_NAELO|nr:uncharacterized protein C9374_009342 [Naegleria lovaniensis]KAG2377431.1 hypothetical protein C9374_009342 [Naegleria lovaniensis]
MNKLQAQLTELIKTTISEENTSSSSSISLNRIQYLSILDHLETIIKKQKQEYLWELIQQVPTEVMVGNICPYLPLGFLLNGSMFLVCKRCKFFDCFYLKSMSLFENHRARVEVDIDAEKIMTLSDNDDDNDNSTMNNESDTHHSHRLPLYSCHIESNKVDRASKETVNYLNEENMSKVRAW